MLRVKSTLAKLVTTWHRTAATFLLSLMLLVGATAAEAAKWFIDNTLGDVKPEEKVSVVEPKPVQLIFEFMRDGKAIAAAKKQVKPLVIAAIKEQGVFSEVTEAPTPNGAILNIVITNIVDKEELAKLKKKAFGAGLSFGLASGVVATDHYNVDFELVPATGKPSVKTQVQHAIHMKYGKTDVAIPGTEVKKVMDAINGMVRQTTARGINNLAGDPGFAAMSAVRMPQK